MLLDCLRPPFSKVDVMQGSWTTAGAGIPRRGVAAGAIIYGDRKNIRKLLGPLLLYAEGDKVSFEIENGPKGPKAINVVKL
jgi:hypothetical protein